eukprot:351875-Chlamydomonas_euryale.AAC.4
MQGGMRGWCCAAVALHPSPWLRSQRCSALLFWAPGTPTISGGPGAGLCSMHGSDACEVPSLMRVSWNLCGCSRPQSAGRAFAFACSDGLQCNDALPPSRLGVTMARLARQPHQLCIARGVRMVTTDYRDSSRWINAAMARGDTQGRAAHTVKVRVRAYVHACTAEMLAPFAPFRVPRSDSSVAEDTTSPRTSLGACSS